jgi:glycosyltransferase involved in cell wall biosynthesis
MRILFVAIGESVHTARWLSQLSGEGWDLHLFPAEVGVPHRDYRNVTIHSFYRERWNGNNSGVNQKGLYWPLPRGIARIKQLAELLAPNIATQSARLARTIRSLKPDIVHVLEMQHAGYLTLEARKRLPEYQFPPCIYSCWGNDIFLFGAQPDHEKRIRAFLSETDYFIADCERDLPLAREYGFRGEVLGVFTTAGGYNLEHMRQFRRPGPTSSRKVIALKGHQTIRGANALAALRALEMCAEALDGYELIVYSASDEIREALDIISRIDGLRVTELQRCCSHEEILKLMGQARIAIGVSTSDGTPNAMLEAMVLGAFPVQSDTVSTAEWIDDGKNGLLVNPENPGLMANAIRRALTDDELVNEAAEINTDLTRKRLDLAVIQPRVIELYRRVAGQGTTKRK